MSNRRSNRLHQARDIPGSLCITNHDHEGQKQIQILKRQSGISSEILNLYIPGITHFQKHFKKPSFAPLKDYALDKEKAINNKIKDTLKSQTITWEFTGGGTRVYCQTGLYSKLPPSTLTYFDTLYSLDFTPELMICKDREGTIVQYTIKVTKQFAKKSGFTINLYNTASLLLINGSHTGCKRFFDNDVHSIMDKILADPADIHQTNMVCKELLIKLKEELKCHKKGSQKTPKGAQTELTDKDQTAGRDDPTESDVREAAGDKKDPIDTGSDNTITNCTEQFIRSLKAITSASNQNMDIREKSAADKGSLITGVTEQVISSEKAHPLPLSYLLLLLSGHNQPSQIRSMPYLPLHPQYIYRHYINRLSSQL